MTTKQIMKLVDALSEASFEQGLNRLRDFPEQAREVVAAAIETLSKDAERYRWLRDGCGEHHIGVYDYAADDKRRFWLAEKNLDREIDAAIAAMKGEQV